jgi:hypothetical protein
MVGLHQLTSEGDPAMTDELINHAIRGIALGRAGLKRFKDVTEVQQWVDDHGGGEAGERALRNAAAAAPGGPAVPLGIINEWLAQKDREREDTRAHTGLEIDRRSAQAAERAAFAAERAARYAMWSAGISAAVGIVTAAAYWLSRAQ